MKQDKLVVLLSHFASVVLLFAFIYKHADYNKLVRTYDNYVTEKTAADSQYFVTWFLQNQEVYHELKSNGFQDVQLHNQFKDNFEGLIVTELDLRMTAKAHNNTDAIKRHVLIRKLYPELSSELFSKKVSKYPSGEDYLFYSLLFRNGPFHRLPQGNSVIPKILIETVFDSSFQHNIQTETLTLQVQAAANTKASDQ